VCPGEISTFQRHNSSSIAASSNEVVLTSSCGRPDLEHAENQPLCSQTLDESQTLGYAAPLSGLSSSISSAERFLPFAVVESFRSNQL